MPEEDSKHGGLENGRLLRDILETVSRVDERTEQHSGQISKLFEKQNEACAKLATLEERTSTQKDQLEQLTELRRHARQSGGGAGAGVASAVVMVWELARAYLWGDG